MDSETQPIPVTGTIRQQGNKCYLEVEIPGALALELNAHYSGFDYGLIQFHGNGDRTATMKLIAKVKDPRE